MKSLIRSVSMLYVFSCISYASTAISPPVVDLGYAKYRGFVNYETNVSSYLGIRYAAPPLGDLRWKAPQPPITQPGLQDATSQPPMCVQAGGGTMPTSPFKDGFAKTPSSVTPLVGTEECLFLNVFAPSKPASTAPLPVIVWIHGGGFHLGDVLSYSGESLIRHGDHDVVVVMMQYRLGLFGFLAGKEVKEKGALNAGLLDQEFALKWVQEHIGEFGGDPHQVTIWGESAGGESVMQHMLAHDGKTDPPLFQRAISNSPCILSQYKYNDPEPTMIYKQGPRTSTLVFGW